MSVNKCILLGNLGKDPEFRSTQDGREIASFSVATTERWKKKDSDEYTTKTQWHQVVVFQPGLIGTIKKYVKKGTRVYIEDQIQTRKWTDKQGIERYSTEVILNNFNATLKVQPSGKSEDKQSVKDTTQQEFTGAAVVDDLDDDIPF